MIRIMNKMYKRVIPNCEKYGDYAIKKEITQLVPLLTLCLGVYLSISLYIFIITHFLDHRHAACLYYYRHSILFNCGMDFYSRIIKQIKTIDS